MGKIKIAVQTGATAPKAVPTSVRYVACISGGEGGFFRSSDHAIRASIVLATNRETNPGEECGEIASRAVRATKMT